MSGRKITLIVYDPPKPGFPYLAATFTEGEAEVTVVPFHTYAEADACIQEMAERLADLVSKDACIAKGSQEAPR